MIHDSDVYVLNKHDEPILPSLLSICDARVHRTNFLQFFFGRMAMTNGEPPVRVKDKIGQNAASVTALTRDMAQVHTYIHTCIHTYMHPLIHCIHYIDTVCIIVIIHLPHLPRQCREYNIF